MARTLSELARLAGALATFKVSQQETLQADRDKMAAAVKAKAEQDRLDAQLKLQQRTAELAEDRFTYEQKQDVLTWEDKAKAAAIAQRNKEREQVWDVEKFGAEQTAAAQTAQATAAASETKAKETATNAYISATSGLWAGLQSGDIDKALIDDPRILGVDENGRQRDPNTMTRQEMEQITAAINPLLPGSQAKYGAFTFKTPTNLQTAQTEVATVTANLKGLDGQLKQLEIDFAKATDPTKVKQVEADLQRTLAGTKTELERAKLILAQTKDIPLAAGVRQQLADSLITNRDSLLAIQRYLAQTGRYNAEVNALYKEYDAALSEYTTNVETGYTPTGPYPRPSSAAPPGLSAYNGWLRDFEYVERRWPTQAEQDEAKRLFGLTGAGATPGGRAGGLPPGPPR